MLLKRIGRAAFKIANRFNFFAPLNWEKIDGRPTLSQVIDWVRRRWRLRILLNGFIWILALGVLVLIISAGLLDHWHFIDPAVWLFRLITIFSFGVLLFHFFVKPLNRRVSDSMVALYLEEHEPNLKSIILSAVDVKQSRTENLSSQLAAQLVKQAVDACHQVNFGHGVEVRKLQRGALSLGLVILFVMALLVFQPNFLRNGAPVLLMPWTDASQYSPYRIELVPGDIEIARGNDQLVSARVVGFEVDQAILFISDDDGDSWRERTMTLGGDAGLYESFLFDLNKNVDYFVEAKGLRSETFRIEVADIPAVSKINLRYNFPAYTLLKPKLVKSSGEISALRGTRVEVHIVPTIKIPGGELVLNDGQRIPLVNSNSDGYIWVADITVDSTSGYKVALQRANGKLVDASPEYRINALDDKRPSVSIVKPGRDVKVSIVEEPIMKVRAKDDQGIANLELVLSVNGAAEQKVKLMDGRERNSANNQIDAEHNVFLEDLGLRAGDLISYYARAEDRAETVGSRIATSDIFFFQVRPFRTDYHRSNRRGGGGGGFQGGRQEGHLSEQQKRFVVATFKMIRDREKYSDDNYKENLEVLSKAQSRIRDRVEAIVRRIGNRAVVQIDKGYKIVAEELPLAAKAMIEVEKKLKRSEIDRVLPDAQVALQHLQRADAAFRDVNIALANRGGARGGGFTAGAEDLANLFRLEMDKLRHQYENVQRGQQQSSAQQIDETLERLRELAHRQQQVIERWRRRQNQALNGASNGKELALAKEVEEMVRRLERLSRSQPNAQLKQSITQMKGAAEAMRRAANATASGGIAQARRAAESLREAQRLLDQSRVQQYSLKVERALRRAELVEKKQAAIKQEVAELNNNAGNARDVQLNEVGRHKDELSVELTNLEGELNKLTVSSREEQPAAIQSLKQALRTGREYRLQDRIRRSREMLLLDQKKHAMENEMQIQSGIVKIREHIETALGSVQEQKNRGLARSLERMRALARELRFIRARASNSKRQKNSRIGDAGRFVNADNQAVQQELQGIVAQAAQLRRRLLRQGVSSGDIDPVVAMLDELSKAETDQEMAESTELHDKVLSALKELEYKLRKKLDTKDNLELLVSESNELPDGYKEMVADYFRKLSQLE